MIASLTLGLSLGAAAGIAPGPLLALVVTVTLRSGWRAGALAACAPVVTDVVVVLGVLLLLDHLPGWALPLLGVVGGVLVIVLGALTARDARGALLVTAAANEPAGRSLGRAALVNISSPHPWIAWATVLGPLAIAASRSSTASAVALVAGFYLALIAVKVVVAVGVAGGRRHFNDRGYRIALGTAGALLALAGLVLLVEYWPQLLAA